MMVVIAYGEHRASEPLAFGIAKDILAGRPEYIGREITPENSDWLLLMNEFLISREYPIVSNPYNSFMNFAARRQEKVSPIYREIRTEFLNEAIYHMHSRNYQMENEPTSLVTLTMTGAVDRRKKRLYHPTEEQTQAIAARHNLTCVYDLKLIQHDCFASMANDVTIEISLSPRLKTIPGIDPRVLDEIVQKHMNGEESITFGSVVFEGERLREYLRSPFLLPDLTDTRYYAVVAQVKSFLLDFFDEHKKLARDLK